MNKKEQILFYLACGWQPEINNSHGDVFIVIGVNMFRQTVICTFNNNEIHFPIDRIDRFEWQTKYPIELSDELEKEFGGKYFFMDTGHLVFKGSIYGKMDTVYSNKNCNAWPLELVKFLASKGAKLF